MSHILAQWLNTTIHPPSPVKPADLDKQYASGYQFCKLLQTFDLVPEASAAQITDADHSDAVVRNWTIVERVLREKLGVVVGSSDACELVRARPGAAAKLLYQIKSAVSAHGFGLPVVPTLPPNSAKVTASEFADQRRLPSYPSSPRVASPVVASFVERNTKKAFEEHEHEAFARLLRDKLAKETTLRGQSKGRKSPSLKGRDYVPLQDRLRNGPHTSEVTPSRPRGASAAEPMEVDFDRSTTPAIPENEPAPIVKRERPAKPDQHQRRKDQSVETLRAEIAGFEKRLREFRHEFPGAHKTGAPPVTSTPSTPQHLAPEAHRLRDRRRSSSTSHERSTPSHDHPASHDRANRRMSRSSRGGDHPEPLRKEEDEDDIDEYGSAPLDAATIKKFVMLQAAMDPPHHLKMMARALPPIQDMATQKKEYLENIRLRKLEDEGSRHEREQRRRKRALEDQRLQEEREVAQLEEVALSKLLRQSKQERRIAEHLLKVRHERQVMRENRIFLEHQYTKRRQKDYEEALAREYDLCERARKEYRRATALQLEQHREILEDKKREKHRKRERDCRDIVLDVLQLAMKVSDFRTLNDGRDVPKKFLEEWKLLFGHNKPLTKQYNPDLEKDVLESTLYETTEPVQPLTAAAATAAAPDAITAMSAAAAAKAEKDTVALGIKVLDDKEFEDYLTGKGDWSYSTDLSQKVLRNKALGKMIGTILDMTAPPDPIIETARLPAVPLKLALIGKPFAGKRTVAKRLAAKYHLTVLSVDELIKNTIRTPAEPLPPATPATPGDGDKGTSNKGNGGASPRVNLGAKVEINMLEGGSPDDALLVSLVVEAIQKLLPPDDASGESGGFILADFPRTRAQAQLLEKELSGYEDPKPVKPGNLKRTPKEKTRRRSQIAPTDPQQLEPKTGNVQSGLDAVIMLDVPNEVAYDRASGRRIDPVTGKMYHLESNPPPVDDPGLMDRVTTLNEDESEGNQVHYQVTAFEDQHEPLKEWFSRFNNLQVVDGSTTFDHAYESAEIIVTHLIERKEREKERKAADTLDGGTDSLKDEEHSNGELMTEDATARNAPITAPESEPGGGKAHDSEARLATSAAMDEEKKTKAPSGRVRLVTPAATATPAASAAGATPAGTAAAATGKPPPAPSEKTGTAGLASAGPGRAGASARDRAAGGEPKDMLKRPPMTAGSERPMTEATERSTDPSPPMLTRVTTADGKRLPSKELAEVLADEWATIESTYTDTLKFAFRSLRREKEAVLRYFYTTKVNFRRFLERPDHKQQLVELFQVEFNHVEDDLRSDPDAKAELHQRAEDLRDKLWDMSDKRKDEAEAERVLIVEDKWVEEHFVIIANVYIAMVQAEMDRYLGTKLLAADYFRDAYGMVLNDVTRTPLKIPLISTNAAPAIDIGALVLNSSTESSHKLHRREAVGSADSRLPTGTGTGARPPGKSGLANAGKDASQGGGAAIGGGGGGGAGGPAALGNAKKGPAAAPPGRMASVVEVNKHFTPIVGGPMNDRELLLQDNDLSVYADVLNACDIGLGLLGQHDDGNANAADKDKKDKKKSVVSEMADAKVSEVKAEPDMDMMPEYQQIVDREDQLLRRKLERLKAHALENLRSLRSKGIEVFTLLDDWISTRFGCEMDAVREMLNVIKEAIEAEAKLPNRLALHGEKFKVDFGLLMYEPDPEPRPPSPVEKQMSDQFTVAQLGALAQQFRGVSGNGMTSWREFIDCFQRLAAVSVGTEQLPDQYAQLDASQLQQICATLDPYETGFVNWRKFLMLAARVLPVPTIDYLLELKSAYKTSSSNHSNSGSMSRGGGFSAAALPSATTTGPWKVSRADYMNVTLWFEEEGDAGRGSGNSGDVFDAKFDRPGKLKEALYTFFEDASDSTTRATSGGKTLARAGGEDQAMRSSGDPSTRITTAAGDPVNYDGRSLENVSSATDEPTGEFINVPSRRGSANLLTIERSGSAPVVSIAATEAQEGPSGSGAALSTPPSPSVATAAVLPSYFDAFGFLMSCCLDPSPKIGLQKAFAVASDNDDGACTLQQVYQVFHFGLTIVEETHRLPHVHSIEDPFPMEMLSRMFEDMGAAGGESAPATMTFEHFLSASESYPQLNSCGLYQIDDPTIVAIKSRPSSAM
ncbi:hypothetical protein DFJ77DRAFT_472693 [Powellomyces hirtus]|nr:hypothetical protein DFJ77DRAFT_472693 [Powellomyces hirtus]